MLRTYDLAADVELKGPVTFLYRQLERIQGDGIRVCGCYFLLQLQEYYLYLLLRQRGMAAELGQAFGKEIRQIQIITFLTEICLQKSAHLIILN